MKVGQKHQAENDHVYCTANFVVWDQQPFNVAEAPSFHQWLRDVSNGEELALPASFLVQQRAGVDHDRWGRKIL